jgi:phosphoribosylformylglycinamidine (FGAM) synthase PurS component
MMLCVEIGLSIPDNEARTALATLQRLGVPLTGLERSDLYRFDVEDERAKALVDALRGFETIFNPNKHVLRVRATGRPGAGEVWVDERGSETTAADGGTVSIGGRPLPGVRAYERFKAWRVAGRDGTAADDATVTAATETLLCNAAFQKAIRA